MSLIDFNSATINTRRYSGNGGNKYGVNFNDENWILKFPKSTQDLNNPKASYATSPLSEYLGSKIYESFGIPVHEVKLGFRKPGPGTRNKLVVACKDFLDSEQRLIEFKNTKNAQFFEGGNAGTSGAGTRLDEVLETIERSLDFIGFREDVRTRFWDMFVVDYVLGNNDRNNTNWGIIATDKQILGLSPVYDNGNSFFDKRNIDQFETRLPDELLLKEDAYETLVSAYVDDSGNHIILLKSFLQWLIRVVMKLSSDLFQIFEWQKLRKYLMKFLLLKMKY
ncbi:HipA domain-containing protein [Lactovum miscens]|uniref:HipA-like C-terminal domain-containing protein n=1 Tax=Lactovum miscens TaxID=190387 RepID=A0A841C5K9_9LACT|nr:HipA domain-containing protein [Lactovum miscens]MBB5887634.1 hypothetical protein [Lactovum miscens]